MAVDTILEVEDLTKAFGGLRAVDGMSSACAEALLRP